MNELKYITIGRITNNQGNKGEVRVIPLTDFPERFQMIDKVYLVKNNRVEEQIIENVWFHKKYVILKFAGIDDIGAALNFKDYYIKIKEKDLVPLRENEYYIYKIVGFTVKTKDDKVLGSLKEVLTTGGTDVLVVSGSDKEYLIPGSKEIVKNIDIKTETIIVDPIPGLLDL
ncbi:MAG: ribosome maturation factor RimM [Halanaerobiales bacterium]